MSLLSIPPPPAERTPFKQAASIRDYDWVGSLPFVLMHLAPLGALWTGTRWQDWAVCVALYWIRMFAVTGFYHRYFSHRTFKMGRVMQFLAAFVAQTSSQKGVLWWAAHHRDHHRYSDTLRDPHSPRLWGLLYAHLGWIFDRTESTDYGKVKDLARYPELVVLNKLWWVPVAALGLGVYLWLGASGLFIGFGLSTAVLWHATFTINSLTHVYGTQRFDAGDDSRNNLWLALLTMGEGWHNNHHYHQGCARQGLYWWEIDVTYYILKVMGWVGLVWDIREPPAKVYEAAADRKHAAADAVDEAA